jgi:Uma2 family endonuclease
MLSEGWMMVLQRLTHKLSVDDFEAFISLPENIGRRFELINGDVVEMPSNTFVSIITARIIYFLQHWILQNDIEGYISGADGGFNIHGQILAPDVAFMRELPSPKGFTDVPPLLAIEVISDPLNNTEQSTLRRKVTHYLRADIVVWTVDYLDRQVEVYYPNESVQVFVDGDIITGGNVLPNFEVAVSDIFPAQPHAPEAAPESDDELS